MCRRIILDVSPGAHKAWTSFSRSLGKKPSAQETDHLGNDGMDLLVGTQDEETEKKIRAARIKKADSLFNRPSLDEDFCLTLLAVQQVNPLVNHFFMDSKNEVWLLDNDFRGPMFDLANARFSPAVRALDAMTSTLRGGANYWQLLHCAAVWTPEMRLKVQMITLRLMANVWYRLVHHYKLWPWPVAKVLDDRVPEDEQLSIAEQLFFANECCLDEGVCISLQNHMTCGADLVREGHLRTLAQSVFNHCKSQTIPVEERFKRVRTHSACNSGVAHSAGTIASNHVLRELKTLHACCKQVCCAPKQRRAKRGSNKLLRLRVCQRRWMESERNVSVHNIIMSDVFAQQRSDGANDKNQVNAAHEEARTIKKELVAHNFGRAPRMGCGQSG